MAEVIFCFDITTILVIIFLPLIVDSLNYRGEENVEVHADHFIELLFQHIRFPMMSPVQLADLLLFKPISKSSTDLLVRTT